MQAGKFDRQVNLLQYGVTIDTAGGEVVTYTQFATVWASVKDLRGANFLAAQQTTSTATTKFILRYRTDFTARDRIEWKGKQYEVIGIPIEVGRNESLEINGKARDEL